MAIEQWDTDLWVLNTSNVIVIQIGVEVTMSKSDAAG
jgi:hypothetical protein